MSRKSESRFQSCIGHISVFNMRKLGQLFVHCSAWCALSIIFVLATPLVLLFVAHRLIADGLIGIRRMATGETSTNSIVSTVLGLDVGFVNDDFFTSPKGAIGFMSLFDGPLDPSQVESQITKLLTNAALKRKYDYERLSSLTLTTKFGYSYWTLAAEFSAKEHLHVLEPESPFRRRDLHGVISKWIETPFKRNRPLWDILLISPYRNCDGMQSVLAVRIHHLVGDGYSLREFMENLFAIDNADTAAPMTVRSSRPAKQPENRSTLQIFSQICKAPFIFSKFVYDFFLFRDSLTTSIKLHQTDQIFVSTSCSLTELKSLRAGVQDLLMKSPVSVSTDDRVGKFSLGSLILYLFGNTLRRFWLEHKRLESSDLPSHVKVAGSLPIDSESHPIGTICNHWTHAIFEMPCGNSNALKGLRSVADNYLSVLESGLPLIHTAITKRHHIIPNFVWQYLARAQIGTAIGFVNLPGPPEGVPMEFCGANLMQVVPVAGRQWKNAGMTIAAYSYNNRLNIGVLACRDMVKDADEGELLLEEYFQEELKKLNDFVSSSHM